jgi:hypothetical protein
VLPICLDHLSLADLYATFQANADLVKGMREEAIAGTATDLVSLMGSDELVKYKNGFPNRANINKKASSGKPDDLAGCYNLLAPLHLDPLVAFIRCVITAKAVNVLFGVLTDPRNAYVPNHDSQTVKITLLNQAISTDFFVGADLLITFWPSSGLEILRQCIGETLFEAVTAKKPERVKYILMQSTLHERCFATDPTWAKQLIANLYQKAKDSETLDYLVSLDNKGTPVFEGWTGFLNDNYGSLSKNTSATLTTAIQSGTGTAAAAALATAIESAPATPTAAASSKTATVELEPEPAAASATAKVAIQPQPEVFSETEMQCLREGAAIIRELLKTLDAQK